MTRELTNEAAHGRALMHWARLQENVLPELALLFHIPNGGLRSKAQAGELKAEGVRAGVPDYLLPVPLGGYHGLFIELKMPKTGAKKPGRLSEEQKLWLKALRAYGYRAETAYGWDEARQLILEYLAQPAAANEPAIQQAVQA